jgi:hypothetical protein
MFAPICLGSFPVQRGDFPDIHKMVIDYSLDKRSGSP